MKTTAYHDRRSIIFVALIVACGLAFVAVVFYQSRLNIFPHLVSTLGASTKHAEFPHIDSGQLSSNQQKIVSILKAEYDSQPQGTKYSEGIVEPWCADFVSWVFKQADMPLSNPNSGSWRIPGTYTLREYYESTGRFRTANSGYSPEVGDIMLYDNPSSFGQHVNIVIKNDSTGITTVGGNEPGGIRVYAHTQNDRAGLTGYGLFDS